MTFSKPTTWAYNFVGWKVKNHYEHKVGDRIIFRNNLLLQVWNGIVGGPQGGVNAAWSARDQNASSNTVYMNTCPWNVIADIRMYNNHILNGSHMFGITAGTDYNGMVHSGRLHVHNNLNYMKGFGQWMTTGGGVTPPTQQRTWHNFIVGAMTDMTVQNNTYIYDLPDTVNVNPAWAMPGYATAFAIDGRIGQLADRCLIADNLIDMASSNPDPARRVQLFYNTNSTNAISSGAGFTRCFTNSLFTNNLMTYLPLAAENPYWDATINFPNVPRASVGFVNLTDSLRPPVQLSDWNLAPSSPYIAASTSGGPLGATLP
jgi:hypothetical protein